MDSYKPTLQMVVNILKTNFHEASHLKGRESTVVQQAKIVFPDISDDASFVDIVKHIATDLLASPSIIIQHLVRRRLFEGGKTFYIPFFLMFLTAFLGKDDKTLLHNYVMRRYHAYPKGWTGSSQQL